MTTGYISNYGGGLDLDQIFDYSQPGVPGDTGFIAGYDGGGQDLARLFSARSLGQDIGYNTGFIALDGRDLREWFAKAGTVNVQNRVLYGVGVTNLPPRSGSDLTVGYRLGVGGSITFYNGTDPGQIEYIEEARPSGTNERLSFLRLVGGGKPWNIADNANLYFRSYHINTGSTWTGFFNYASSSGEWQTIDDCGFTVYPDTGFEFEIRNYPF